MNTAEHAASHGTARGTPREARTKGILAGLAGLALLLGSGTFALWSSTASQTGGTITNGDLDIAATGTPAYYDVSADRTDTTANANAVTGSTGHGIDSIATWLAVPGDTVEANYGYGVTLTGDNLVANLTVTAPTATPTGTDPVTFAYDVYRQDGTSWTRVTPTSIELGAGVTDTTVLVQATGTGQGAGADDTTGTDPTAAVPVIAVPTGSTANLTVVVTATFPEGATTGQNAYAALGTIDVGLQQVRAGTNQFTG